MKLWKRWLNAGRWHKQSERPKVFPISSMSAPRCEWQQLNIVIKLFNDVLKLTCMTDKNQSKRHLLVTANISLSLQASLGRRGDQGSVQNHSVLTGQRPYWSSFSPRHFPGHVSDHQVTTLIHSWKRSKNISTLLLRAPSKPEWGVNPFLAEDHGLWFWGADLHSSCFSQTVERIYGC